MRTAVGIDLGGTKIAGAVVDEHGAILTKRQVPSDVDHPENLVLQVVELARELVDADVAGVGVGAAGIIDHARGRYLYGPNTGLRQIDLAAEVTRAIGLPSSLDNDANCAAWGEHRFGCGRGASEFLCITLGTGIGGGYVFGGRPYRGAHGGAGEVGHMLVDPDGPQCGCGRRGCWEQFASGMAMERAAFKEYGRPVDGPDISKAAREGDEIALKLVERTATWIGWGLASLVNVFEPERIAIAGGIAQDWDLFSDGAVRAMSERAEAPEHRPMPEVLRAELGPDAGVVGAAMLVLSEAYA